MRLVPTRLPGVVVVESKTIGDERGWFMEAYNALTFSDQLRRLGQPEAGVFVQDNHSCSAKNVLRGFHYQLPPNPQGKLVRVLRGAVFDVAVDLRRSSPSFAEWVGVELSAKNARQLWIPPGFAHAFLALDDETHLFYKCTGFYSPECEASFLWNDSRIAVEWPLAVGDRPQLSKKDAEAPAFSQAPAF